MVDRSTLWMIAYGFIATAMVIIFIKICCDGKGENERRNRCELNGTDSMPKLSRSDWFEFYHKLFSLSDGNQMTLTVEVPHFPRMITKENDRSTKVRKTKNETKSSAKEIDLESDIELGRTKKLKRTEVRNKKKESYGKTDEIDIENDTDFVITPTEKVKGHGEEMRKGDGEIKRKMLTKRKKSIAKTNKTKEEDANKYGVSCRNLMGETCIICFDEFRNGDVVVRSERIEENVAEIQNEKNHITNKSNSTESLSNSSSSMQICDHVYHKHCIAHYLAFNTHLQCKTKFVYNMDGVMREVVNMCPTCRYPKFCSIEEKQLHAFVNDKLRKRKSAS